MTSSTAHLCACGTRIVGCGYVDATNPPTNGDGPRLCRSCAVDHCREVPGSIAPAPPNDRPESPERLSEVETIPMNVLAAGGERR
jgi:hypothetical protein